MKLLFVGDGTIGSIGYEIDCEYGDDELIFLNMILELKLFLKLDILLQ
jgi:hypothetical protein